MLYDQPNQRGVLKVYDPNTWQLLGTSTKGLEAAPCEAICFGRYDAHGYTTTASHYYDDLMVDFTHATFPLLPALTAAPQLPLSLSITGAGIVSGPANNALLEIGKSYTATAKPAPGNLFAGWSGSVMSPSAKLHFVMESNLTLTASFVSNYFQQVKGTYNGLFYNSSDPQQASSGYATMTVNSVGTYSGKLTLNAKSYSFHGTFAPDSGTAEQVILRPGTNALRLQLSLDLINETDRLTGTVAEEASGPVTLWSAALSLDRATFTALNPAPYAGRYTLYIPRDTIAAAGPMGDSVGTLTLSTSGALTATWAMADGTKSTRKTTLSKTGRWPLYAPLYKDKGSLLSPVQFDTNQQNTDLAGPVVWFKQAQSAKYYPEGFTNSMTLMGSRYLAPAPTTAMLVFSNPDFPADFTNEVALSPGAIVNQSTNKLSVSLNKSSGLFQGTVTPPTGSKPLVLKGVLFQKQNLGAGFVMGTNQSGLMLLTPETP
jgi:hypothetical protein